MHKYFAATSCPGPYLESKFPYIAEEVNKKLKSNKELTSVNNIVWELNHRGIITDKFLWLVKLTVEGNAYWLARKIANLTKNSAQQQNLALVNDIVWELNYRGIILDIPLWLDLLSSDINLYWLARKACNMTENK